MTAQRDIAVLVGSLRKESLNRKTAKTLIELAPDHGPRPRSGAGPRGPRRAREDRGPEVTTWGDDKPARKPRHKG